MSISPCLTVFYLVIVVCSAVESDVVFFMAFLPAFLLLPSIFFFCLLTLAPVSQAKVRELEEKCRSQSEQFNLLSKELEKFRLHAGKFDILSTEPLTVCESPGSPSKSLSQLLNGLAAPTGKGRSIQPSYQPFVSSAIPSKLWCDCLVMNLW